MRGKADIQYRDKFRKPRLDGVEAQAQRGIFGVGNFRRVVLVIRPVVALDLARQPLVPDLGLGPGELIHVAAGDREDRGRGDRWKHDGGAERLFQRRRRFNR
jgi:hypothetical protein